MLTISKYAVVIFVMASIHAYDSADRKDLLQHLGIDIKYPATLVSELNNQGILQQPAAFTSISKIPLFDTYPLLRKQIPHISLGSLPTPITRLEKASQVLDVPNLYVKRDDVTGALDDEGNHIYGGNKVRKLEFLLADAFAHGASCVMTFGCAGSNHALATAVYAQRVGLKCICLLKPQANSHVVRNNLKMHNLCGTELYYYPANDVRTLGAVVTWLQEKNKSGNFPYVIPTGGSCSLGALGYVNAAFELKAQVDAGVMPEPDKIYVACGSCGTTAGLILGCKLAGLKTKVIPVAVEPDDYPGAFKETIVNLMLETNKMLHETDASVPLFSADDFQVDVNVSSHGEYGVFTQDGMQAKKFLKNNENIILDGTYSAKAFAGLLKDVEQGAINKNEVILFWNTFCGLDYSSQLAGVNYKNLPRCFDVFHETSLQELDVN